MSGFAAAIGGAGEAAGKYGTQIRGLLEQRREHLASLLATQVLPQLGSPYREEMMGHLGKLMSNEPIGKTILGITKTMQGHAQDEQAFAQAGDNFSQLLGPQPQTPPPAPVPTRIGEPAGTSKEPAALPSTSPIANPPGPIQPVGGQPTPPEGTDLAYWGIKPPAPETQPQTAPATVAPMTPQASPLTPLIAPPQAPAAEPSPFDPAIRAERNRIIQEWDAAVRRAPQVLQGHVDAEYKARLEALAPYEQQANKMAQLQAYKSTAAWHNLSLYEQNYLESQARGFTPMTFPSGVARAMFGVQGTQMPADDVLKRWPELAQSSGVVPGQQPVAVYFHPMDMSSPVMIGNKPVPGHIVAGQDQNGQIIMERVNPYGSGPIGLTPIQDLPHTTIQTQPGMPPISTRRTIGGGEPAPSPASVPPVSNVPAAAAPATIPSIQTPANGPTGLPSRIPPPIPGREPGPVPTGPEPIVHMGTPSAAQPSHGVALGQSTPITPSWVLSDPAIAHRFEAWKNGGPMPTGRELTAVTEYAHATNQTLPVVLSPAGQKGIESVDSVMAQIQTLKAAMQKFGFDKNHTRDYYTDYINYAHGIGSGDAKYKDVWTNISFERLRSAAAALNGLNSRAYQIINAALSHTPDPELTLRIHPSDPLGGFKRPDTASTMYNKLLTMENILTQQRDAFIADERKGGTIPAVTAPTAAPKAGVPAVQPGDVIWGRDQSGRPVKVGGGR